MHLVSLKQRRLRGDLIKVYKMIRCIDRVENHDLCSLMGATGLMIEEGVGKGI